MMRYRIALILLLFLLGIALLSLNFPIDSLGMARELTPTPAPSVPFEADKIRSVQWSPDGMTALVMTDYATINHYAHFNYWLIHARQPYQADLTARRLILQGRQLDIRFSPDSQFIVIADAQNLTNIWDTASFDLISTIPLGGVIDLSSDGRYLAIGRTGGEQTQCSIWLYELGSLAEPQSITTLIHEGREGCLNELKFYPDNQRLISISFGLLRLWDLETLEAISSVQIHSPIYGVWVSSDNSRLILAGFQEQMRVGGYSWLEFYDLNRLAQATSYEDALLYNTGSIGYAVSTDETMLVNIVNPYTCDLLDMATGSQISTLRCSRGDIYFSEDGNYIYQLNTENVSRTWSRSNPQNSNYDTLLLPVMNNTSVQVQITAENRMWLWSVSDALSFDSDMHVLPQIYATIADVQSFIPEIIQYDLEQFAEMQP